MYHYTTASAPGRVCFAGEDIDWISGPSILGAINLRIEVAVRPLPQNLDFIELKSGSPFNVERNVLISNIGKYDKHVMDYVEAAVKVLIDRGLKIVPIQISVTSSLPAQAGLSSSAAVTVASIAALARFFKLSLTDTEICELGYHVESEELKTGAGQMDFYPCGLGGFMYINSASKPPFPIEKYNLRTDNLLIIADTNVPRNTADIIRAKRQRLQEGEAGIISYVKYTEIVIEEMHSLIMRPPLDFIQFGSYISLCHKYLREYMRVSTDLLDACVKTSLMNGALGAKLTGTGMGGCMFALAPKSAVTRILEALAKYPVDTFVTNISNEGVIIETSAP